MFARVDVKEYNDAMTGWRIFIGSLSIGSAQPTRMANWMMKPDVTATSTVVKVTAFFLTALPVMPRLYHINTSFVQKAAYLQIQTGAMLVFVCHKAAL